ncbi:MAG: anthranilate phosphoribosyltransferase [Verrucomicrobiales bacterium]
MDALIRQLQAGAELEPREVAAAAEFLLDEAAGVEGKIAFLKALSEKGETAREIAEFVQVFLERAVDPGLDDLEREGPTIDVCGTGGDKLNTFNVSTTSMFVVAAGGATVVKHGNRGITSKSGGADVLEALGITIDREGVGVRACLEKAGVGFLFAPAYHPAFKAVVPVRQALAKEGVRTIFNLIGPLLNPARPQCQLVGVMNPTLVPVFAEILQRLGRESAWVVNGETQDGRFADEVSLFGPTRICKAGTFQDLVDEEIAPGDFGLELADLSEVEGGEAAENAEILEGILSGRIKGAKRDLVALNAGAALACAGLADDMEAGLRRAFELIESGAALERLRNLQELG